MPITSDELDEMFDLANIIAEDKGQDVGVMSITIVETARLLDGPEIGEGFDILDNLATELSVSHDAVLLAVSLLTGADKGTGTARMLAYGMVIGHKLAMKQVHS